MSTNDLSASVSAIPLGGKESSALDTPLLPVKFPKRSGTAPPLLGFWSPRRHRAGGVQQLAQRGKPLARSTRPIDRDLLINAALEHVFPRHHAPIISRRRKQVNLAHFPPRQSHVPRESQIHPGAARESQAGWGVPSHHPQFRQNRCGQPPCLSLATRENKTVGDYAHLRGCLIAFNLENSARTPTII